MNPAEPVIWILAGPDRQDRAGLLKQELAPHAKALIMGPGGGADLTVDLTRGLDTVLSACPAELRPHAAACLTSNPPQGLDCLPCCVLGTGKENGNPGSSLEGDLPPDPAAAAGELLALCSDRRLFGLASRVQVNLPLKDLLGRFRQLVKVGGINFEVGVSAHELDNFGPEHLEEASSLLSGSRVTVHLPFFDLCPGSSDPLVRKTARARILAAAEWAVSLGAVQAVAHLGYDPRLHRDLALFTENLARTLAPVARALDKGGARLCLENTFEKTPEPLLAAREKLADEGRVGFCLDVGHATGFTKLDIREWWRALKPHLFEMHLHDNDTTDDLHWPVGWGRVDWDYLAKRIKLLPSDVILTLEPHEEPHLWASLRGLDRLGLCGARGKDKAL